MVDPVFKPALIIVDLQEDFCPPNGSLAVPSGRDIVPIINALLALPFVLKIATKDWHPADHISFASNHAGKSPFVDSITIVNPYNDAESYVSRLWPDHCIQGTPGAELLPELEGSKVDVVIEKGQDRRTEMYSAFSDPFREPRVNGSLLGEKLRERDVTDVFVVGLAFDYCVGSTAVDAVEEGFKTWVVREGTRAVDDSGNEKYEKWLEGKGVRVVGADGIEVQRVRELGK